MAKLELFLLGRPQIYLDGQAVTDFNTRKDCALLAYLAVTGTTHSRETLAGLLWSGLPEASARRNLRHSLTHLQKVIGPQWLTTERGVALTQKQPWSVDVDTLRSTVKNLSIHAIIDVRRNETQEIDGINGVLNLYRGEFLQGFYLHEAAPFEDWVLVQREESRLLTLRGLEVLVKRCLAQGAYDQGLEATHRLLQLEPWSEPAHCLQMQLLAQSGRRVEALAQYETCRKALAAELGVAPLPTTTALYQQIQAGQYTGSGALAQREPRVQAAVAPPTAPVTVTVNSAVPNNLVTGLAGFVGRQTELAFISQRLAAADCRLLTIVGPGGMGKTSLAYAAAQHILHAQRADFPDGIYFVSLLDIDAADDLQPAHTLTDDPAVGEAMLRAVAEQIGYKLEAGVAAAVQLQAYLRPQRILLVLDNFEHLLAGTAAVVTLLTQAPQLKALITSRARLNVRGESVLVLSPLPLPTAAYHAAVEVAQANPARTIQAEIWQTSEAIAMFVQRAQQIDHTFAINAETIGPVGQICQLVGGLPLGIELATSMLPLLNCRTLAAALASSLAVLAADTRDLPREQRTLGAVFERSWRLLPPEGQQLLAKLAIFPGSFGRDAAMQITGATGSLLRRLLDQSLLDKVGDNRYAMHRTVHAFAQQKLQQRPEQQAMLQVQYAHFYLEYLARLEQEQAEAAYATTTEQIQVELDNVRTAWRWSVDQGNLALLELGVESLQDFYRIAGIYLEAIQLLETALPIVRQAVALATGDGAGALRLLARLLCYTAQFYRLDRHSGQVKKGESLAQEALELGHRLADPALQALAYHELARLAQTRGDFAAMSLLSEQACTQARQANLPHLAGESLNNLGIAVSLNTHPLTGIPYFQEALDCLHEWPNRDLEGRIMSNLGYFHLVGHNYQSAYHYLQQSRTLRPLLQERENSLIMRIHFANLWVALGAYSEAQQGFRQGLAFLQTKHARYWESWLHASYGRLQYLQGDLAAAQTTCRLAWQVAQKDGSPSTEQWALINWGHTLTDLGDLVAADSCYQQAIAAPKGKNWLFYLPDAHAGLAALCLVQNEMMTAVIHTEAALALLTQQGLAAAGDPFAVYWTCVRVLQAAGDPRAQTVLATTYQLLQETANQLEDKRLRRSFLENVVANRQLVAAAQATGIVTALATHAH